MPIEQFAGRQINEYCGERHEQRTDQANAGHAGQIGRQR
jgi:hypothetical protein